MNSLRKIGAIVAGGALMAGALALWYVERRKATERTKIAESLKESRLRAEQGDPEAESRLGSFYYYGRGVEQSYAEAADWYRKAAEQGNAQAEFALGIMYLYGRGVVPDYPRGVDWYRRAAAQGDPRAQTALAALYFVGRVVPQDYEQAVSWYRKAAGQGNIEAQTSLGVMYLRGRGVPQSPAEARRWFEQAARQGDGRAQLALGEMYRKGEGVPQSYRTAAYWYAQVLAGLFGKTHGGPLGLWPTIVALILGVASLLTPQMWRGRVNWVGLALCSAMLAAMLTQELLSPGITASLIPLGLLPAAWRGLARGLLLTLLGVLAGAYAYATVKVFVERGRSEGPTSC
jgi:hypothetical protein